MDPLIQPYTGLLTDPKYVTRIIDVWKHVTTSTITTSTSLTSVELEKSILVHETHTDCERHVRPWIVGWRLLKPSSWRTLRADSLHSRFYWWPGVECSRTEAVPPGAARSGCSSSHTDGDSSDRGGKSEVGRLQGQDLELGGRDSSRWTECRIDAEDRCLTTV